MACCASDVREPCPIEGRCAHGVEPCPPTGGAKADAAPVIPLCGPGMLFEDDRLVFVFFTLYIFVGGVCYCQCFSCATALFAHSADRALSATVMNVIYYAGVCVASVVILASNVGMV